ncbi:hypothetical protein BpHYR1_003668, partial [Brachionus plicatilis]
MCKTATIDWSPSLPYLSEQDQVDSIRNNNMPKKNLHINPDLTQATIRLNQTEKFETSPRLSPSKNDLNMGTVENARAMLKNTIKVVSAKSVMGSKPDKNSDVAFEIEFQDPNQKPIKCRCRTLPCYLKEKVSTELDRQLKAEIIRP